MAADVQFALAQALNVIGDQAGDDSALQQAVEAYREALDHFLGKLNRLGFPFEGICDSCFVLVKEASTDGFSLFPGFAQACDRSGLCGRELPGGSSPFCGERIDSGELAAPLAGHGDRCGQTDGRCDQHADQG